MANKRTVHETLYVCLGKTIARRRKQLKLSQQDLAELSGVNRAFLSNVEQGKRNPSIGAVASIAQGLSMRISRLLVKCDECIKDSEEEAS
ncbi:MAG: helix-turn-helix transcriptional regulator [Candidatus Melainabacteria bacterium]|nr:helix-turn-helix transcriptional regulator [Candidatus Melainabacteria bacterium]